MSILHPPIAGKDLVTGYASGSRRRTLTTAFQFELKAGELVSLLGPNGSGKSTLLKTLSGLIPPLSGKILLNGTSISAWSAVERARFLAVSLPRLQIPDGMTGQDFVALGRIPHTGWTGRLIARDKEVVRRALESVEATHMATQLLGTLSDGERQRLALARILAQEAKLVLLDEPTAFLDLPHRILLFRLLRQLAAERNICLVVSTHELDLALRFSDRVWILDGHGGSNLVSPPDSEAALADAFGSLSCD